jgi:hypothetical protein
MPRVVPSRHLLRGLLPLSPLASERPRDFTYPYCTFGAIPPPHHRGHLPSTALLPHRGQSTPSRRPRPLGHHTGAAGPATARRCVSAILSRSWPSPAPKPPLPTLRPSASPKRRRASTPPVMPLARPPPRHAVRPLSRRRHLSSAPVEAAIGRRISLLAALPPPPGPRGARPTPPGLPRGYLSASPPAAWTRSPLALAHGLGLPTNLRPTNHFSPKLPRQNSDRASLTGWGDVCALISFPPLNLFTGWLLARPVRALRA